MPSEWILVVLHEEAKGAGRERVRRRLERLGAATQLEFKDGFVVRMENALVSKVRSWKEVRVAGGVHARRKEVPRIRVPVQDAR